MLGEIIISITLGTSEFWSIIFSKPLPIEVIKKVPGTTPISVEKK